MPQRKVALSEYLTREEWQLCFSLGFAHQYFGDVGSFDSFAEELRYAIRYLAENGFEFEALTVAADGRIQPTQEEPVCPENMASVALIVYGSSPDYETHLEAAIAFAEEAAPHLTRDIELMREVLGDVGETLDEGRAMARAAVRSGAYLDIEEVL